MTTVPITPDCPLCDTWAATSAQAPADLTRSDLHSAFVLGAFVGLCCTDDGRRLLCPTHKRQLGQLAALALR